ncbi:lipase family protein [Skermania piniformis]
MIPTLTASAWTASRRRWAALSVRRWAALAIAFATSVLCAWPATADPIGEVIEPTRTLESVLPTPLDDPFSVPPAGYADRPAGAVLRHRPASAGPLPVPVRTTQLSVRSTDVQGRPIPVIATVVVPTAPWTGSGPRPVVGYNLAIDSLGHTCAPSYQLSHGLSAEMALAASFLTKNYALVITDYQGPREAYAAGRLAAHAVLDALRGALHLPELGLSPDAPVAVTGYSGGAIASGWTAELAGTYAPELNLTGVALGGIPADYRLLLGSMNGRNLASSLFLAAALGVAREYPELLTLLNDNGWRLAGIAKDMCLGALAAPGVLAPIPIEAMSDIPDVLNTPIAQRVLTENRLGGRAPSVPVYLYQGEQDPWITVQNADNLYADWCAAGATAQLQRYLGEHMTAALVGAPGAYAWIDDRLAGRPVEPGCETG